MISMIEILGKQWQIPSDQTSHTSLQPQLQQSISLTPISIPSSFPKPPKKSHPSPQSFLSLTKVKVLFIGLPPPILAYLQLRRRQLKFNQLQYRVYVSVEQAEEDREIRGNSVIVVAGHREADRVREIVGGGGCGWMVVELVAMVGEGCDQRLIDYMEGQGKEDLQRLQAEMEKQQQTQQQSTSMMNQEYYSNSDDDSSSQWISTQKQQAIESNKCDDLLWFTYIPLQPTSLQPTPKNPFTLLTELSEYTEQVTNLIQITNTPNNSNNKRQANLYHHAVIYMVNTAYQGDREALAREFFEFFQGLPEARVEKLVELGEGDEEGDDLYVRDCDVVKRRLERYESETEPMAALEKIRTIFHMYTQQTEFHKSINRYLKYFPRLPLGPSPLQYPTLVLLECIQALFNQQLPSLLSSLNKEKEMVFYRGCRLGVKDRAIFVVEDIGNIVQWGSFMSTTSDPEIAAGFTAFREDQDKYLLKIVVPYEQLEYYMESQSKGTRIGQGFVLIESFSEKPHENQSLFNLLNYYKVAPTTQQTHQNQSFTVYTLQYVNALKIAEENPRDVEANREWMGERELGIRRELRFFYLFQNWKKDLILGQGDMLVYGEWDGQAKEYLDEQLNNLLTLLCPQFSLKQFLTQTHKILQTEKHSHPTLHILPYLSHTKLSFSTHQPQQWDQLIYTIYKHILYHRRKLQVREMHGYACLYVLVAGAGIGQTGGLCGGLLWKIYGLIYLSDCYFLYGLYELRGKVLKQAYKASQMFQQLSKNKYKDTQYRCTQKVMSRIFDTQKLLKRPHDKKMVDKFYKLIEKDPIDERNFGLLYRCVDGVTFTEGIEEQLRYGVGGQRPSAVFAQYMKLYILPQHQTELIRPQNQLPTPKLRSQLLTSLFGTDSPYRIHSQLKKYSPNLKPLIQKITSEAYIAKEMKIKKAISEGYEGMGKGKGKDMDMEIDEEKRERGLIWEIYSEFVLPYLRDAGEDVVERINDACWKIEGCPERDPLVLHLTAGKLHYTQHLQQILQSITLKIKHNLTQQSLNLPQPQPQSQPILSPSPQQTHLTLLTLCKSLPLPSQPIIRTVYIRIYSELFALYASQGALYGRCAEVYEMWKEAVFGMLEGQGEEREREVLEFQWLVVMEGVCKVVDGFLSIKSYIQSLNSSQAVEKKLSSVPNLGPTLQTLTLSPPTHSTLTKILNLCLSHTKSLPSSTPHSLTLLHKQYHLQATYDQLTRKKLTPLVLGSPDYFRQLEFYAMAMMVSQEAAGGWFEGTGFGMEREIFQGMVQGFKGLYRGYGEAGLTGDLGVILKVCLKNSYAMDMYYLTNGQHQATNYFKHFVEIATLFKYRTDLHNKLSTLNPNPYIHSYLTSPTSQSTTPVYTFPLSSSQTSSNILSTLLPTLHPCGHPQLYTLLNTRLLALPQTASFFSDEQLLIQALTPFLEIVSRQKKNTDGLLDLYGHFLRARGVEIKGGKGELVRCLVFYLGVHGRVLGLWMELGVYREDVKGDKMDMFLGDCLGYYQQEANLGFRLLMLRKLQAVIDITQKMKNAKPYTHKNLQRQIEKTAQQIGKSSQQPPPITLPGYISTLLPFSPNSSPYMQYLSHIQTLHSLHPTLPPVFLPEQFSYNLSLTPINFHIEFISNVCRAKGRGKGRGGLRNGWILGTVLQRVDVIARVNQQGEGFGSGYWAEMEDWGDSGRLAKGLVQDQSGIFGCFVIYLLGNFVILEQMRSKVIQYLDILDCYSKNIQGTEMKQFYGILRNFIKSFYIPKTHRYKYTLKLFQYLSRTTNNKLLEIPKDRLIERLKKQLTALQRIKFSQRRSNLADLIQEKLTRIKEINDINNFM